MNTEKRIGSLKFEVVWEDPDMLEAKISASNQFFEANSNVYCGHGSFQNLADELSGFPKTIKSVVTWDTTHQMGLSSARLVFRCIDSSGHVVAEVSLRSVTGLPEQEGNAEIIVPLEPAAIDRLAIGLARIEKEGKGVAQTFEV